MISQRLAKFFLTSLWNILNVPNVAWNEEHPDFEDFSDNAPYDLITQIRETVKFLREVRASIEMFPVSSSKLRGLGHALLREVARSCILAYDWADTFYGELSTMPITVYAVKLTSGLS